jgi:hypothetical protein
LCSLGACVFACTRTCALFFSRMCVSVSVCVCVRGCGERLCCSSVGRAVAEAFFAHSVGRRLGGTGECSSHDILRACHRPRKQGSAVVARGPEGPWRAPRVLPPLRWKCGGPCVASVGMPGGGVPGCVGICHGGAAVTDGACSVPLPPMRAVHPHVSPLVVPSAVLARWLLRPGVPRPSPDACRPHAPCLWFVRCPLHCSQARAAAPLRKGGSSLFGARSSSSSLSRKLKSPLAS